MPQLMEVQKNYLETTGFSELRRSRATEESLNDGRQQKMVGKYDMLGKRIIDEIGRAHV